MITQLNPPLPLQTPKGAAWAVAIIDYGPDWDLCWITFVANSGECWTFHNKDIRQTSNLTFGHMPQAAPEPQSINAPNSMKSEKKAQFKYNQNGAPYVNGEAANVAPGVA
jgi:hypothetical protein